MVIGMDPAGWGTSCHGSEWRSRTWLLCVLEKGLHLRRWGLRSSDQQSCIFSTFSIFVLALLTLPSQASNAGQAGFDLPQPNGCHPVGSRTIVLRDPRRSRDLLVTMWYPAVEGTSAFAPYMDKKTANALAEEWKLQPDFQRLVRTHADSRHPSLIRAPLSQLSFWNTAQVFVPAIYTVLAEGLAS